MLMSARTWSAWVGAWLIPALAIGAEIQGAGTLGMGYTNNIRRVSSDEQGEGIAQAGLELAVTERTRRLDADLVSDLAYMDYLQNTYGSQIVGDARGHAALSLIEDHLTWTFLDNFGQTQPDLFAPVTPQNSENINYFSTGPDLTLRLAPTTELRLGARYVLMTYATSPSDSDRVSGSMALTRNIAERSSVSLNAEHEHVEFSDQSVNTDFDSDALYLAYAAESNRTKVAIDAGVNRITIAGTKENGSLLRLELSRKLTARSTLDLAIGRDLTDAASSFGSQKISDNVSLNTQSLGTSSNPYTNEYINLGWHAVGSRTRLGASIDYSRENYVGQSSQDRDLTTAEAYLSRDLGPRLSARLVGNYTKDDFEQGGDYDEMSAAFGFSFLAGKRLRLDLSVERYDRSSDIATNEYRENRAWLKLRYGDAFVRHVGPFGSTQSPTR